MLDLLSLPINNINFLTIFNLTTFLNLMILRVMFYIYTYMIVNEFVGIISQNCFVLQDGLDGADGSSTDH